MPRISIFTIVFICTFCGGAPGAFSSAVERDLRLILSKQPEAQAVAGRETTAAKIHVSEVGLLAGGLIKFYQVFISSQDVDVCNFYPSCSRFTAASIRKYGPLKGSLLSADRLMRCHWFSHQQHSGVYSPGGSPGKIVDLPEYYSSHD